MPETIDVLAGLEDCRAPASEEDLPRSRSDGFHHESQTSHIIIEIEELLMCIETGCVEFHSLYIIGLTVSIRGHCCTVSCGDLTFTSHM